MIESKPESLDTRKRRRDQHSSALSPSLQMGTKPVMAPFEPHVNPVSTHGRFISREQFGA